MKKGQRFNCKQLSCTLSIKSKSFLCCVDKSLKRKAASKSVFVFSTASVHPFNPKLCISDFVQQCVSTTGDKIEDNRQGGFLTVRSWKYLQTSVSSNPCSPLVWAHLYFWLTDFVNSPLPRPRGLPCCALAWWSGHQWPFPSPCFVLFCFVTLNCGIHLVSSISTILPLSLAQNIEIH